MLCLEDAPSLAAADDWAAMFAWNFSQSATYAGLFKLVVRAGHPDSSMSMTVLANVFNDACADLHTPLLRHMSKENV